MFGGFCLLFFVVSAFSRLGAQRFFCQMFSGFGQIVLNGLFGFCLESLILAQDERWRRA